MLNMNNTDQCQNCAATLPWAAQFCSQCGQKVISYDRPVRPVLTDMLHESLDIDGRLMRSLITLFTRPGFMSLEYRNGRRNRYTPPLRLYLAISILFFLLVSLIPLGGASQPQSSAEVELYPKLMFVLLPIFAGFLQVLFRNTFYLSNLVFAIHLHCLAYLVIGVAIPLEAFEDRHFILVFAQFPLAIYLVAYVLVALKRFYQETWLSVSLKFIALALLYSIAMGLSFDYLLKQITG